jgi:2-polyprenyl-3-methyl-5-hydroxy-6-metoxy-1,4-benzoquinol methylase
MKLIPSRINLLPDILVPYLKGSQKILDLGSFDGKLAQKIEKKLKIKIVGVDKLVPKKTYIPVEKYDGKHLPFQDNSFDCVMLIDVLHHDTNHSQLIKEARRVSKRYILVKDYYWENQRDLILLKYVDYIFNAPNGVDLPYNFLRVEEWLTLFRRHKLCLEVSKKFRYFPFHPCPQVIFKLDVSIPTTPDA